jgi:anti-anti-sigma factor
VCDQHVAITNRQINPEWLILDLCGAINSKIKDNLDGVGHFIRATAARHVVLNFGGVSRVDGTGLKLLLLFCVSMRQLNRKLACYGMNREVLGVFRLARVENMLNMYPDEASVLALAETD